MLKGHKISRDILLNSLLPINETIPTIGYGSILTKLIITCSWDISTLNILPLNLDEIFKNKFSSQYGL